MLLIYTVKSIKQSLGDQTFDMAKIDANQKLWCFFFFSPLFPTINFMASSWQAEKYSQSV